MKLGVTRELPLDCQSILSPYFDSILIQENGRPMTNEELRDFVTDRDVLICQLTDAISDSLLARASKLKHIATFSVGVDHLDLKAIKRRGIRLSHTPGVLTDATANLAWALILSCSRRLKRAEGFVRDGKFNGFSPGLFLGLPLERCTLGIVGMGKIGQAVAKRGEAFGMKVQYHTRTPTSYLSGQAVSFEELIATSDVVSIHCPLTPVTQHLFDGDALKLMKPTAVLVNTARGPIIDEKALAAHLIAHPDFYAGLDVFEYEPKVTPGLVDLPNVVCVPHIGSASQWAREQMAETCIQEAMRFASGQKLLYEYVL